MNNALKIESFNADYSSELGYVYLELGFNLRAKKTFEKAIKADSSNQEARKGVQKIKDAEVHK